MPRDTLYYAEFNKGGTNYRLEIRPASPTTWPSSPSVVDFSESLTEDITLESAIHDKLPIGLMRADTIDIKINLTLAPHDLVEYLNEPYTQSANITFGDYTREIKISNFIILRSDEGNESTPQRLVGVFTQKQGVVRSLNMALSKAEQSFKFVSLWKVAQENVKPVDVANYVLWRLEQGDISCVHTDKQYDMIVHDYVYYSYGDDGTNTLYAMFVKIADIEDTMHRLLGMVMNMFGRTDNYTPAKHNWWYGHSFMHAFGFYKQLYTEIISATGDTISVNDLYICAFTNWEPAPNYLYTLQQGGWLIEDGSEPSLANYENLFEFWEAAAEGAGIRMKWTPGSQPYTLDMILELCFVWHGSNQLTNKTINLVESDNIEIKLGDQLISSARVQIDGMNNEDAKEFEHYSNDNASQTTFSADQVFHNVPSTESDQAVWTYEVCADNRGFFPNKLYYYDDIEFTPGRIVRVHERVAYYNGVAYYDPEDYQDFLPTFKSFIQEIQKYNNTANTLAKAISETFGQSDQATVQIKTMLLNKYAGSHVVLNKDISELPYTGKLPSGLLTPLGTNAIVVAHQQDLIESTAELKLLVRGE